MIVGSYKNQIHWRKWKAPKAREALERNFLNGRLYTSNWETCGSSALSLITGLRPKNIEKQLPPRAKHWSDRAAIQFLRKYHFHVCQVTKCGVTNTDPLSAAWDTPGDIDHTHVLLCNNLVCRDEASWFVITGNVQFHNFETRELSPLFFVNRPSQSMYLVWHKKWA